MLHDLNKGHMDDIFGQGQKKVRRDPEKQSNWLVFGLDAPSLKFALMTVHHVTYFMTTYERTYTHDICNAKQCNFKNNTDHLAPLVPRRPLVVT